MFYYFLLYSLNIYLNSITNFLFILKILIKYYYSKIMNIYLFSNKNTFY